MIEEYGLALEDSGRWLVPELASSSEVIELPFLTNHSNNPNITTDYEFAVSDICRMVEVTFVKEVTNTDELCEKYGDERFRKPPAEGAAEPMTPETTTNLDASPAEGAAESQNSEKIPSWTTQATQATQVDSDAGSDESSTDAIPPYQVYACYAPL